MRLVALFDGRLPDAEIQQQLHAIAADPARWPDAHRFRSTVRRRLLATHDALLLAQYNFAESCLESLYNETDAIDPFDSVSPFWVVPRAIWLAAQCDMPIKAVMQAIHGNA